jgi:hypothetical protein
MPYAQMGDLQTKTDLALQAVRPTDRDKRGIYGWPQDCQQILAQIGQQNLPLVVTDLLRVAGRRSASLW